MEIEAVDPLALRAAAKYRRKSLLQLKRLVFTSVGLVWSAERRLFIGLVLLQLAAAVLLVGQVLAVRSVLQAILVQVDQADTSRVAVPILVLAVLTGLSAICGSLQTQLQRLLGEHVAHAMWNRVLDVSTRVSLRHFESSEFFNQLSRVQTSALSRPYQVTQGLLSMAGALVASVALGAALFTLAPVLVPLVAIGGVPVLLASRRESRLEFDFSVQQTPTLRLRSYLGMLQLGRDEAKEVRALGLGPWLTARFNRLYASYLADLRAHVRQRTGLSVLGQVGAAVVLGATLLVMVWLIGRGLLDIAGAGAALVAIRMLTTQVQLVFRGAQSVFESGLFLDDLDDFLALGALAREEDRGAEAPTGFSTIRVEGVTFSYPEAAHPALRGVDVELSAGQIVALVGENGSGKTTLAKLLAGLYKPDAGAIRWDGRDLSEFGSSSVRERVTVVFQDFVRFALTATENIAAGRIGVPVDPERVRAAARSAGAERTLDGLPRGFDTILSRIFAGGQDLSGGQWQRIALARSFYRDAPLVILDEPTASLDPRAEHALFTTLRTALHGRTALFISHRFATVRGADRIYVLHEGQVVEQGTHEELIDRAGRYAELYRLQSTVRVGEATGDGAEARTAGDLQ
jgi:ATP-binding cassette, subfamily B, bacterial